MNGRIENLTRGIQRVADTTQGNDNHVSALHPRKVRLILQPVTQSILLSNLTYITLLHHMTQRHGTRPRTHHPRHLLLLTQL